MIEVAEQVSEVTVVRAYKRAIELKDAWSVNASKAAAGMRAAKARDPKLLMVLERCAEVMHAINERELGQYQRNKGTAYSHRFEPQEVQWWREAYRTADKGDPLEACMWMYAAAGEMAGIIY